MPTVFFESMNLGDLLKYEALNIDSRDHVRGATGQTLALDVHVYQGV